MMASYSFSNPDRGHLEIIEVVTDEVLPDKILSASLRVYCCHDRSREPQLIRKETSMGRMSKVDDFLGELFKIMQRDINKQQMIYAEREI